MWKKELDKGEISIVKILDKNVVILMDPADVLHEEKVLGKNRTKEKQYAFDFAFNDGTSQIDVFKNTTQFLCEGVLNGYNSTVFAYGQTGAGKTFTMLGNEENPGIMFNTMKEVFKLMKKHEIERDYTIRVSFLEIYNENIKDLIMVSNDVLDLREDPLKGVQVAGLSEIEVHTPDEIFELLIYGNRNRTQEATGANETSSRSHAVLQIIVEYKEKDSGIKSEIKLGKLSLIDLAGSERAAKTGNRGMRMIEGANINKSLLALGNCINMLHENNSKG
jgi:kinesin family member 18/19|tara:strand:+ start:85 stop:915 length:831 start_codon:yes stop_codon:yes gene_type:complete